MPRRSRAAPLVSSLALLPLACSASGTSPLQVGSDGTGGSGSPDGTGGAPVLVIGDSGTNALSAHIESPPGMKVEFITLSCESECADVEAVVTGGYAPYALSWEDGSTDPRRHVCPSETTAYQLAVTDSGNTTGEVRTAPETVHAHLTANVLACTDAGAGGNGGRTGADAGSSLPMAVPGVADLWLAGLPDGASLACGCAEGGSDVTPANAPVSVPVTAGRTLGFAVSGATSLGVCAGPTPDGGCLIPTPPLTMGPANGLSSIVAQYNALIGVFLDDTVRSSTAPAAIDVAASTASTVTPLLQQVFFIGDGLTGTGTGATQRFVVPPGATRLFLGSSDGPGGNYNNAGTFTVVVTTR